MKLLLKKGKSGRNSGFLILIIFALIALVACAQRNNPPQTINNVELNRYVGKWYEIASYPMFFQRGCYCTTAEYYQKDDKISVINSCHYQSPQGKLKQATAIAYAIPNSGNSKLKVQFYWPFKADYWILYVDKDYQYAIVTVPSRKYLWILARTPSIPSKRYQQLITIAQSQSYDINKLRRTDQSCFID